MTQAREVLAQCIARSRVPVDDGSDPEDAAVESARTTRDDRRFADQLLASLRAEVAERGPLPVGDELVLVPREPTEQMVNDAARAQRAVWEEYEPNGMAPDEWVVAERVLAAALGVPRDEPVREGETR